jgi:spermidine/putrescine transport system permease protein
MNKNGVVSKAFLLFALMFLYTPIVVLIVMSFNSSRYNQLPFEFSLQWYQEIGRAHV